MVSTGGSDFSGVVRGNKTTGVILELLKKDTTQEEIVAAMEDRFDAPAATIAQDVERVLGELRKIGALDE